ncbi:MAG: sensor histidine kinase [Corynebacteriales bacterium]|nr:sensor histidine kinase [Mycobacteriales bacterium]
MDPIPSRWQPGTIGPRAFRGRRRTPTFLLPTFAAIVQLIGTLGSARHQNVSVDAIAITLVLAGPVVLVWRKKYPVQVFALVVAITASYFVLGYPPGPIFLSPAVALFRLVSSGHRLLAWSAVIVGVLAISAYELSVGDELSIAQITGLAVWTLLILSAAEAVRIGRIARAEARRTFAEEQRRRAADERLSIARELHDVLAHNISLINVRSSVALHLLDSDPEQARTALVAIKKASKDTLREMRSVLGVLRRVDEQAPRAPTPGLAELPTLAEQFADSGITVRLTNPDPKSVPTSIGQGAYRIAQEALTNVLRHSQAKVAYVHLEYSSSELTVRIDDAGPPASKSEESGGNGIVGMRERASALGGSLTAVSTSSGGFSVTAHLPLTAEQDDE